MGALNVLSNRFPLRILRREPRLGENDLKRRVVIYVEDLIEKAKVLVGFDIPARYPNGFPEGAPFEHYGRLQSAQAINDTGEIFEFVRSRLAEWEKCDFLGHTVRQVLSTFPLPTIQTRAFTLPRGAQNVWRQ